MAKDGRGLTAEERAAKKVENRKATRVRFYLKRMREAGTSRGQLQQCTDYAKAVGDEIGDEGRRRLAARIAQVVEEVGRDYGQ